MPPFPTPGTVAPQAPGALAIALLSAWLTVELSQRKFRDERMWDRKVQAYERIIDAFHKSKKFSSEHLDAQFVEREVPDERDKELRRLSAEAREEIVKATDIGSFTLSVEALELLASYQRESADDDHIHTWSEHLEHDYGVTNMYLKLVIAEAKRDLKSDA
jgi:uncharacterized membrane protein YheB (UPF0754 family)